MFLSGTMKEVNPADASCGDDIAASATAPQDVMQLFVLAGQEGMPEGLEGPDQVGA